MATTKATSSYLNQAPRTLAEVEAEMGLRPRTVAEVEAVADLKALAARVIELRNKLEESPDWKRGTYRVADQWAGLDDIATRLRLTVRKLGGE